MVKYFRAKWDSWRINRWLKLRREDVEQKTALRKAFLTPDVASCILQNCLNAALSHAGLFAFTGGRFSPDDDWMDQIRVVSWALADIAISLPKTNQQTIKNFLNELTFHNWGAVRAAASEALEHLQPDEDTELAAV